MHQMLAQLYDIAGQSGQRRAGRFWRPKGLAGRLEAPLWLLYNAKLDASGSKFPSHSADIFEAAVNVSGTLAVVFRGTGCVFEIACNVSSVARDVSGPSGKVDGHSRNPDGAPKNSGGRPEKENTRRIFLFSSSAESGMRYFSRIPPLVPAGLREKAGIMPPVTPGMRHIGHDLRQIYRKAPPAGPSLLRNSR